MPGLEHLPLLRLAPLPERRKRGGFPSAPPRDYKAHASMLREQTQALLTQHKLRKNSRNVNPALILKVQLSGSVTDEEWRRADLVVLADDPDKTLILFASDEDLKNFRRRIERYGGGPAGTAHPPYAAFIDSIERIADVAPEDRLGLAARAEGFCSQDNFADGNTYSFDVALWDLGDRQRIDGVVARIEKTVVEGGGEVCDRYLNRSLLLLRVSAPGQVFKQLLDFPEIAEIDLPPTLDIESEKILDLGLHDVDVPAGPVQDLPLVAVLDSGITEHPLLAAVTVAAKVFPESLNAVDVKGHGTGVAGIAVYGDLRSCLDNRAFRPGARIISAKVVNDRAQFPDDRLIPNQMRACIETLHREHGVRIFNISLADIKRVYNGGKPSAWAAVLDELARELDIVIVLAAGNRRPPSPADEPEHVVTGYPAYLFDEENRLFEPATSALSVTVGALAHGHGLPGGHFDAVHMQPITQANHPSPFTRTGYGVQGAIKPEFSDYAGTNVFDGMTRQSKGGEDFASCGVIVPHHAYVDRFFTAKSATSFAAPCVAFKAAQILKAFPEASANLLRALMANASTIPNEARELLNRFGSDACYKSVGYGVIDLERAVTSTENRVVLWAEETLAIDHFAVFEVPVPSEYQSEPGLRWIKATLAFDPPVRHTRADYLGVTMNFRLVRGWSEEQVFEHFRKRDVKTEGRHPDLPAKHDCNFVPKKNLRDAGTLQSGIFEMKTNIASYGDPYFLAVRAEGGWATDLVTKQNFAVVVEIGHQAQLPLYARVQQRVQARIRARL